MDKFLYPGLEEGHQLKPDVHKLVAAHDGLGVLSPSLTQWTSGRLVALELQQVLFLLIIIKMYISFVGFHPEAYFEMMRSTLIQSNVHVINNSGLQHLLGLIKAVFSTSIVIFILGQNVH